jgi:hypothetical protein
MANEPTCKPRVLFYTLEQKKKWLTRLTLSLITYHWLHSPKWWVQPVQIHRWTAQLQPETVLPAYPEERSIVKDHKNWKHGMKKDPQKH